MKGLHEGLRRVSCQRAHLYPVLACVLVPVDRLAATDVPSWGDLIRYEVDWEIMKRNVVVM